MTGRPLDAVAYGLPPASWHGAVAWTLLAAALLMWAAPAPALVRARRLSGVARLAPGRRSDPRRHRDWAGAPRLGPPLGVLVTVTSGVLGGVAAAVACAALGGVAWILLHDRQADRRARLAAADLLTGTEVIVGELDAGAQPAAALLAAAGATARHDAVLHRASTAAAAGGDAAAVLLAHPGTTALGVAWQVGQDGGTALSGVLRRVAADLRAVTEQRRVVQVALSGPRSSAVLLAGLPLLGIVLGVAMGAQPFAFLTGSPAGRAVGCAGVLLDAGGVLWMRAILRRASRS